MKKLITIMMSVLLVLPMAGGVAAQADSYTLYDVTNALKYIAGWGDEYYNSSYDYNADKKITTYDAICMLKVIAGWDTDNICLKKPSDEYIRQIEEELAAYHADQDGHYPGINYDVRVRRYYGTYDGAAVIFYTGGGIDYHAAYWTDYVAGSEFFYNNGNSIKVWKDGDIFFMKEAYDNGILTKRQVARVAEVHKRYEFIEYERTK